MGQKVNSKQQTMAHLFGISDGPQKADNETQREVFLIVNGQAVKAGSRCFHKFYGGVSSCFESSPIRGRGADYYFSFLFVWSLLNSFFVRPLHVEPHVLTTGQHCRDAALETQEACVSSLSKASPRDTAWLLREPAIVMWCTVRVWCVSNTFNFRWQPFQREDSMGMKENVVGDPAVWASCLVRGKIHRSPTSHNQHFQTWDIVATDEEK